MLLAQGESTVAESRLKSAIFLERRFRVYVAWRERLLFDTKFAPPAERASGAVTFLFMLEGRVSINGGPALDAPLAFALAEHEFERIERGAATLRSWGDPYVAVELRVPAAEVSSRFGPVTLTRGAIPVPSAVWDRASVLVEAIASGELSASVLRPWLEALEQSDLVARGLSASIQDEPEHLQRMWRTLAPGFARHATNMSLLQVKRELGLSLRQLHRDAIDLGRTFDLLGDGFRSTQKLLRLRAAVLWLSAPEATLLEVAHHVGYRSVTAMNRALRDVGLPGPSVLREELRFAGR